MWWLKNCQAVPENHLKPGGALFALWEPGVPVCSSYFGGCSQVRVGGSEIWVQRWKKRGTRGTPSMLIFSSCANFWDFHKKNYKIFRIFANLCCVFAHFCKFLHIFAFFCIFLHFFGNFCMLCPCYISRFFQLCSIEIWKKWHT